MILHRSNNLVLIQLLDLSIKLDNKYLFFETLIMIAELYQMFGDNQSCLNTYIRMVKINIIFNF